MMYWEPTVCPKCGSTDIQHEVEIPVKYIITNTKLPQVQLVSTMAEVTAHIDKVLSESDGDIYCTCNECGWGFWV